MNKQIKAMQENVESLHIDNTAKNMPREIKRFLLSCVAVFSLSFKFSSNVTARIIEELNLKSCEQAVQHFVDSKLWPTADISPNTVWTRRYRAIKGGALAEDTEEFSFAFKVKGEKGLEVKYTFKFNSLLLLHRICQTLKERQASVEREAKALQDRLDEAYTKALQGRLEETDIEGLFDSMQKAGIAIDGAKVKAIKQALKLKAFEKVVQENGLLTPDMDKQSYLDAGLRYINRLEEHIALQRSIAVNQACEACKAIDKDWFDKRKSYENLRLFLLKKQAKQESLSAIIEAKEKALFQIAEVCKKATNKSKKAELEAFIAEIRDILSKTK